MTGIENRDSSGMPEPDWESICLDADIYRDLRESFWEMVIRGELDEGNEAWRKLADSFRDGYQRTRTHETVSELVSSALFRTSDIQAIDDYSVGFLLMVNPFPEDAKENLNYLIRMSLSPDRMN